MDRISSKRTLAFDLGNVHVDGPEPRERWQVLLRIVGDFAVRVEGRDLYTEVDFTLMEFAAAAARWLRIAAGERPDLTFTSMEAEEEGLVWVRRADDGWRVGSVHQSFEAPPVPLADVDAALSVYLERLRAEASRLGVDFDPVLA